VATKTFLHVGLPKSGTTYLQAVLTDNKQRLTERAQLLFPCRTWKDQVRAVRDVRGASSRRSTGSNSGAWQALREEVDAWDGEAIVSVELLGGAPTDQVARIVDSLAPARVEVIVTARDLARTIPAAWQEFMQNAEIWSWTEFLGSVTSEQPRATPPGNLFWSQQDLGKILAIWRDSVPAEQLHVITLPQPGAPAGVLWSRFAQVLGIDPASYDASGRGGNESLGRESAELMLRLNRVARAHEVDWKTYDEMFKQSLAKRGLAKRRHIERAQRTLPPELEEWTVARTAEQVRAIQASGANLVGDLTELDPVFDPSPDDASIEAEALLEAALDGLVMLAKDRAAELDRLRRRLQQRTDKPRPAVRSNVSRGTGHRLRRALHKGKTAVRRVLP